MKLKKCKHISYDQTPSQDDLIVDRIKDQLEEKMQASAMDINVISKDQHVCLSGMVDVLSEKKASESIARCIEGIEKIENRITVAMDSNISDKHMELEIIDKLRSFDSLLSIGVKVHDGVCNLIGSSRTLKDAHDAMNLASEVRGIKDVVNNVRIESYNKYDDAIINSYVTQALSQTDLSYKDIAHSVYDGQITLKGFVNNHKERDLAKKTAMNVEGITKVINSLQIRK